MRLLIVSIPNFGNQRALSRLGETNEGITITVKPKGVSLRVVIRDNYVVTILRLCGQPLHMLDAVKRNVNPLEVTEMEVGMSSVTIGHLATASQQDGEK